MPILGLSGWKSSGKDALAAYLVKTYGAHRVALADTLKDLVAQEFGIERGSLDDPERKEKPILTMPVLPKDAYTKMIAEFMFKEFRTADGFRPTDFGFPNDNFMGLTDNGYGWCKLYHTPRSLAILKGSTNRVVSSDFWTQKTFDKIENILVNRPDDIVVVTDVRYKSELQQFKDKFGDRVKFVRINRFKESPSNDPSERDLDNGKFDHYVDNTGTLEQAYRQMDSIVGMP